MSDTTYTFRTALGGFHKGDVTAYIEKLASQHRSELLEMEKLVTQLRSENQSLQQQVSILMLSTPVKEDPMPEPQPEAVPEPVHEPVPVAEPEPQPELNVLELQAYRRAEAVERMANRRAKKLYEGLNSMNEETLNQFKTADEAVQEALDAIRMQSEAVEKAYWALSDALNNSREKLTLIAPDVEEETEEI